MNEAIEKFESLLKETNKLFEEVKKDPNAHDKADIQEACKKLRGVLAWIR